MTRLRVAAHVHSDWSYDGIHSLRRLALVFGRAGYDAILLAEHDRGYDELRWREYRAACARASTPRTVLVPGIEYSDPDNVVHIPVWGDIPFLGAGRPTGELLARCTREHGFAVLAHPGRRDAAGQMVEAWLDQLDGVELWNRKYDGYAPGPAGLELLRRRADLIPFVSLDLHSMRQLHPLAMHIELAAGQRRSEAAIVGGLHARRVAARALARPVGQLVDGPACPVLRGLERARRHLRGRRRAR